MKSPEETAREITRSIQGTLTFDSNGQVYHYSNKKIKDVVLKAIQAERDNFYKYDKVGRLLYEVNEKIDELRKERNAFQTQAGARKRECFELRKEIEYLKKCWGNSVKSEDEVLKENERLKDDTVMGQWYRLNEIELKKLCSALREADKALEKIQDDPGDYDYVQKFCKEARAKIKPLIGDKG